MNHKYTYSADGRKLKVEQGTDSRDYVGSVIYENGSLKRILIDGAYIQNGTYYYYLTDHLGNNRVVASGTGTVLQKNEYYPFGMPMATTANAQQDKQPYKYNGKEFERKDGLRLYDFEARMMDPALGRFTTMDPMAEKYYSVSPYAYLANNPMRFVDPDGRDIVIWYNDQGEKKYFIFNGTNQESAPKNDFVQAVITAYDYNLENGGGKSMQEIATASGKEFRVNLVEFDAGSFYRGEKKTVYFTPLGGLEFEDGNSISPATILEHEMAHAVDHKNRSKDTTRDPDYGYVYEKNIILGAELETAKANGELPKNHKGRKNHNSSKRIITKGVTSNKEDSPQKTAKYRERVKKYYNNFRSE